MSISVLNTDAGLSGKTIQDTESSQTVTGLKTFDRDPSAPFAVSSGSAVVTNLNADKVDGYDLPASDGTSGQVLSTNGAAALSWVDNDQIGITDDGTRVTQIAFKVAQSASVDANTLDDYEEGSWTPTDASGAALSFSTVEGSYVKIGQLVIASCTLTYPATGDGSSAIIGGLPFTIQNTTNNIFSGLALTSIGGSVAVNGVKNTTTANVVNPTSLAAIVNSTLTTGTLRFTLVYRATA